MDDDEREQDMETNIFREFVGKIPYVGYVLQSIRVRRGSILSYYLDREFTIGKFNLVLRLGIIFWIILYISQIL